MAFRKASSRKLSKRGGGRKIRRANVSRVRMGMIPSSKVHLFKRTAFIRNYLQVSSAGAPGDYLRCSAFSPGQIPNYAEIRALYDMIAIRMVKWELIPQANVNIMADRGAPMVHSVLDYNDDTVPTSVNQLLEYNTYKSTRGLQTHKRVLRPRTAPLTYQNSGTTIAYATGKVAQYVNTEYPDIGHYGIKWAVNPIVTGGNEVTMYYDVKVTFYFSCKNVR